MPFALGYRDYLKNAVVAGGSWLSTLPLTNIQTDDLQEVARSASLDPDDTKFTVDLGAIRNIGMIVVGPINASPTLQYQVRSYAESSLSTVKYDSTLLDFESGTLIDWSDPNEWLEWEDEDFWLGITASEYSDLPLYIVLTIMATDIVQGQAQYWQFELFDPDNADGWLSIGGAMLFRIFRPTYNYAPDGNEFSFEFLQDENESKAGRRTFTELGIRRSIRLSWNGAPEDEGFDDWMRVALLSRTSRRIFILPEESETGDRLRLRSFPATFRSSPALAQANIDLASTVVDAVEVI